MLMANSILAFDTHKFVTDLTTAGMKSSQAEVLAQTYADLMTDRLATKDDIALVQKDIAAVRESVQKDIAVVQKDIAASEDRLNGRIEASEDRLNGRIDTLQKDIATSEDRLIARIEASEDRLNGKIDRMVIRTALMVAGLLGPLIVLMRFLPAS